MSGNKNPGTSTDWLLAGLIDGLMGLEPLGRSLEIGDWRLELRDWRLTGGGLETGASQRLQLETGAV